MEVLSMGDSGIGLTPGGGHARLNSDSLFDGCLDESGFSSIGKPRDGVLDESLQSSVGAGTRDSEDKDSGIKLDKTVDSGSSPTHWESNEKRVHQPITVPKVPSKPSSRWGNKRTSDHKKSAIHQPSVHDRPKEPPYDVNPEAVPFLPQNFMSSTVLKKIAVPKRHMDTFGGMEYNVTGRRGVILHTDRYHLASFQPFEGMSQRDRLIAELTYMEKLRGVKRRREVLPHRAALDLVMGGRKIEMEERFDINREIQKLKSLVLPQHARELYHGRGIKLPGNHASLKPRGHPYDISEEVSASAPSALLHHGLFGEGVSILGITRRQPTQPAIMTSSGGGHTRMKRRGQLPSLSKRPAMKDESFPVIKSRHAVLPSVEASSLNRSPAAWVADQNRRILEGGGPVEVPAPPIVEDNKHRQSSVGDSDTDMEHMEQKRAASPDHHTKTAPSSFLTETTEPAANIIHPLKGEELVESVPASERDLLRATFQRLDTDMDGSLNYTQLKTQLPESFSPAQELFVKHVYDLTRSSTSFFGVEDFMNMTQLTQALGNLEGAAMTAFQMLDSDHSVESAITKFVELFQLVDRSNRGKISSDSVRSLLNTALERDLSDDLWTTIKNVMGIDGSVSKLEFLAHIPYFLSVKASS